MKTLTDVLAPAKLNLFLHITGQRPDGYHLIESVFMLIDWCDVLHFELNESAQITRRDLNVTLPAEDLIVKAAKMLQSAAQIQQGVTISVEKNIPSEAGMGGGSSDAASTLVALNRLWGLNWPMSKLLKLGLQLGADVPFFIRGRNAFVQGIGEILTPMEIESAQFLVVKPPTGIETRRIFTDPSLQRSTKNATISDFAEHIFDFGRNDLQPVAERLCPDVGLALKWLSSQGLTPRMSGSGSSVFAKVPHTWSAPESPKDWQVRMCSNLEKHPLEGWVFCDDF